MEGLLLMGPTASRSFIYGEGDLRVSFSVFPKPTPFMNLVVGVVVQKKSSFMLNFFSVGLHLIISFL